VGIRVANVRSLSELAANSAVHFRSREHLRKRVQLLDYLCLRPAVVGMCGVTPLGLAAFLETCLPPRERPEGVEVSEELLLDRVLPNLPQLFLSERERHIVVALLPARDGYISRTDLDDELYDILALVTISLPFL
jgi:hypothetical protein